MSLVSSIRTRYLAWSQSTPLSNLPDIPLPVFQRWHAYDTSARQWAPVEPSQSLSTPLQTSLPPTLQLLTWNIDAFADEHESRIDGVLFKIRHLLDSHRGPDVVFFQEVSKKALAHLLQNTWVRENWLSSEADEANWAGVPFATMTLLSRARFGLPSNPSFLPGPLWRVKYPSRYGRDALCCDIFWNSITRLRLINVHLDSLDIQPNKRPRQVAIAADLLRTAGVDRGLIAGDWNPVSKEDATLVQENGLVDAWERLHPGDDGFTWGLDGKGAPFPPGRLDKVAMVGLEPVDIRIINPETLSAATGPGEEVATGSVPGVEWSDHSGLLCSFGLGAAT